MTRLNDVDSWIYFDGPEPEWLRPLLDAARDLPPATREDKARLARRFFARIDEQLSRRDPSSYAPKEPEPAEATAPQNLAGTADAVIEIPEHFRKGAWPFRDAIPGEQRPRTLHSEVPARAGLGETLEAGDDRVAKALAEMRGLPFEGSKAGAGAVPFPQLTVYEYASFCAELSVWPERRGAIVLEYGVLDGPAREALDAHWRRETAAHADVRATFEGKLAEFTQYLRKLSTRR